ncbi:aspartic proteinase Asp1-like [Diospyros lotus]|uniref:aspartic proteinase Asp1-like n=1 Tax=Diospyros lotus TaxID=55363 RepID=UPI002250C147|nr:aspartic proteinase Asp1-like [Diospyros lotus]
MGDRRKGWPSMAVIFLALFLTAQVCFSAAKQPPVGAKLQSSVVLPVQGDINRNGALYTTIHIGNPPKPYILDIDTGSDLTWVQCAAARNAKLLKGPNSPYKPKNNALFCKDPLCPFVEKPANYPCEAPNDQCDYQVDYADSGSSLGVLVRDYFTLKSTNGHDLKLSLAFGCGYDQEFSGPHPPPYVDGVLGLANGRSSIVSQLKGLGVTRNVFGHCFGRQGKGFIFFGDVPLPSGLVWAPMFPNPGNHYMLGPADLFVSRDAPAATSLNVVFDSGSTYTYLNSQAYNATVSLIKRALEGKPWTVVNDGSLPLCWRGAKPVKHIDAVKNSFSPLVLSFPKVKNAAFVLPPEAYLLVTPRGNVCLGILNGADANLGNLNVIGDISLQDKLVVYDNERRMIGWASKYCNKLPAGA